MKILNIQKTTFKLNSQIINISLFFLINILIYSCSNQNKDSDKSEISNNDSIYIKKMKEIENREAALIRKEDSLNNIIIKNENEITNSDNCDKYIGGWLKENSVKSINFQKVSDNFFIYTSTSGFKTKCTCENGIIIVNDKPILIDEYNNLVLPIGLSGQNWEINFSKE